MSLAMFGMNVLNTLQIKQRLRNCLREDEGTWKDFIEKIIACKSWDPKQKVVVFLQKTIDFRHPLGVPPTKFASPVLRPWGSSPKRPPSWPLARAQLHSVWNHGGHLRRRRRWPATALRDGDLHGYFSTYHQSYQNIIWRDHYWCSWIWTGSSIRPSNGECLLNPWLILKAQWPYRNILPFWDLFWQIESGL